VQRTVASDRTLALLLELDQPEIAAAMDEIDRHRPGMYFDRDGEEITMGQWSILFGHKPYQILQQDHVGPYFVSTVWLGMNHQWVDGPPMIFETMVFGPGGDDETTDRYPSEDDALAGHERRLDQVRLLFSVRE